MKTKISGLLLVISSFCIAQTPNIDSAKTAIQNLINLSNSTNALTNAINNCNYGPFYVETTCKVCVSPYGAACLYYETDTNSWSFPLYAPYLNTFKPQNLKLINDASDFSKYYQPLKHWFLNELPGITDIMQNLKNTKEDSITIKLQSAITSISNCSTLLNTSIDSLNNWSDSLNNDFNIISTDSDLLNDVISIDSSGIYNYIQNIVCNSDHLITKWRTVKNSVLQQRTSLISSFNNASISANSVNQNLGCINGPLIILQFKLNGILNELRSAQINQSTAIKKIQILVAEDLWIQLTQFAQQEFNS